MLASHRGQCGSWQCGGAVPRLAELGRPAEALEVVRAVSDERRRSEWRCWPSGWPSWAGPPRPSRRPEPSMTSRAGPGVSADPTGCAAAIRGPGGGAGDRGCCRSIWRGRCWPSDWPSWAGPPRPSRRRGRSRTLRIGAGRRRCRCARLGRAMAAGPGAGRGPGGARVIADAADRAGRWRRRRRGWPSWAGPPRPSRRRGRSATRGGDLVR